MNRKEAKTAAIASADGGGNIAAEVGWEADNAGGRNDAEDNSDDDDGVDDSDDDNGVEGEGARDINQFPANTDAFLLNMYLTFAHVGGNNQKAIVALFKRPRGHGKSVMPAARERHLSSDWRGAMRTLYTFLVLSTNDHRAYKRNLPALDAPEKRRLQKNASLLNRKEAKTAAIASVDGGDNTAAEVGWEADNAGGPIVELPVALVPHQKRVQDLLTDLSATNATAKVEEIEEIFAEGGKNSTKIDRWARFLKLVTPGQRKLLDQARAKRLSNVNSSNGSIPMQHQRYAQAQVTNLMEFNATAKVKAIEKIFSEDESVHSHRSTKSQRWTTLLISVTPDQRVLLDEGRAKRLSGVKSATELIHAVQRRNTAKSKLAAERKGSENDALPPPTTGEPDHDILEHARHKEKLLARFNTVLYTVSNTVEETQKCSHSVTFSAFQRCC